MLEPAGMTEADARAADARHLPAQAALSTAIFGAFAEVVAGRAEPKADRKGTQTLYLRAGARS